MNGTRPRNFLRDTRVDVACGIHRVTHSSSGIGWYVFHVDKKTA